MKILDENAWNLEGFFPSNEKTINQDVNSVDRLEKLRTFLSSKRIPFQEKIEENHCRIVLIENGLVEIHSPYTSDDVSGSNELVLSRVKLFLKQFVDWF